jgi:hypothetical protein
MIETTEGNPLALACLASNFTYNQDKQDKRAWQDTFKELRVLLNLPEEKIVLGHRDYASRSLWAAMKICLASLQTTDAKAILFFLYASKDESLSQEVLQILHAHGKTSSSTFNISSGELLMRELVKARDYNLAPRSLLKGTDIKEKLQMRSRIWSIRSLVKLYVEDPMANNEDMKSVIGALVGAGAMKDSCLQGDVSHQLILQDQRKVVTTLCALYLDRGCINRLAMNHARETLSLWKNNDENLLDLRRKAIEPIIWLLDQPEEENWLQHDICYTRKVWSCNFSYTQ